MISPSALSAWAAEVGLTGAAIRIERLDPPRESVAAGSGSALYPASMIKVPLAVAAGVAVSGGRLDWTAEATVTAENMTVNDAPSPLEPGYRATTAELVDLMVARSDNVATNVLIDVLGRDRVTADLAALGFPGTAVRRKLSGALPLIDDPAATGRNIHPADDAARLFRDIADAAVPGAALIRRALEAQYWNAKLSAGLDDGDRFAHKTGDTDEVSHDGGILVLNGGERFVLVVYTALPTSDETDRRFAAFMRRVRPQLAPAR